MRSEASSVDVSFLLKNDGVGRPWVSEIQCWHVAFQGHSGIGMRSGAASVDVLLLFKQSWCWW